MKVIHFEKYPEPKKITRFIGDRLSEETSDGEWVCEDTRVRTVYFNGALGIMDERPFVILGMVFKNGHRWEKRVELSESAFTVLIYEAAIYLDSYEEPTVVENIK
jgi:hypothetical protein